MIPTGYLRKIKRWCTDRIRTRAKPEAHSEYIERSGETEILTDTGKSLFSVSLLG
jgi:hypothetical protein